MARPRKDTPPDRFTSTEMSVAAGISARNFGVLVEAGLAPEAASVTHGKQTARLWDSFGLGEVAVIGAVHACGVELMMSAKIAHLVVDEFVGPRGILPSRLQDYLNRPLNPNPGRYPWTDAEKEIELRIDDDFWLHHLLRTKTEIFASRAAINGDLVMEIVDRRYVFTDFAWTEKYKLSRVTPWGKTEAGQPDMSLEIEGWERGKEAVVKPLWEILGRLDDPDELKKAARLEKHWLEARQNAVGLLRVNVSLAIRNAFDAVHDYRISSGSSFDWMATGKPEPDRYRGCDANGYPLDIDHHWYADLSREEREKRKAEIEEYLSNLDDDETR